MGFKFFYTKPKVVDEVERNIYFDLILRRIHFVLLGSNVCLAACVIFLILRMSRLQEKMSRLQEMEHVYVVSEDQTRQGKRSQKEPLSRTEYELVNFTNNLLEKIFSNDMYSFEENIKTASRWMDEKSAHTLLTEMNKDHIQDLYKMGNATSEVSAEEIIIENIAAEKNSTGQQAILVKYKTLLRFLSAGKTVYENEEINGNLYFEIAIMNRSFENPWGMQIRNFKFD